MTDPVAYLALVIPWQSFQTLTFKSDVPPAAIRVKMLFKWHRAVAQCAGVHKSNLMMMAPAELGEKTGRFHFHPLLAGFREPPKRPMRFAIMKLWQQSGGGFARSRLCGNASEDIGYALKDLPTQAQDEFETRRLNDGRASNVIITASCWKYAAKRRKFSGERRFSSWVREIPAFGRG